MQVHSKVLIFLFESIDHNFLLVSLALSIFSLLGQKSPVNDTLVLKLSEFEVQLELITLLLFYFQIF